mmetsp:Transcript_41735/g.134950  ORF Transcript_41735/g.134950 Transcript_41735/m.134950 type:complete len:225 (+) Transcript_41735:347-1021(+)
MDAWPDVDDHCQYGFGAARCALGNHCGRCSCSAASGPPELSFGYASSAAVREASRQCAALCRGCCLCLDHARIIRGRGRGCSRSLLGSSCTKLHGFGLCDNIHSHSCRRVIPHGHVSSLGHSAKHERPLAMYPGCLVGGRLSLTESSDVGRALLGDCAPSAPVHRQVPPGHCVCDRLVLLGGRHRVVSGGRLMFAHRLSELEGASAGADAGGQERNRANSAGLP